MYECAYEAGFCGFWIQKDLEKEGIRTRVVKFPETDDKNTYIAKGDYDMTLKVGNIEKTTRVKVE